MELVESELPAGLIAALLDLAPPGRLLLTALLNGLAIDAITLSLDRETALKGSPSGFPHSGGQSCHFFILLTLCKPPFLCYNEGDSIV